MKLSRLIRRDPDAPSLRERAAGLKAGLARVVRREPVEAAPSRRAVVGGLAAVAVPLPVLAAPVVMSSSPDPVPHPDQALFDAEAAMLEAERIFADLEQRSATAWRLMDAELGICPAELLATHADLHAFHSPFAPTEVRRCRVFQWARAHESDDHCNGHVWTAEGLRTAIRWAVPLMGQGGQTPHHLRRYCALLPAVEAYGARRAEIEARHRTRELSAARRDAGNAVATARDAIDDLHATTPEGLAVLVRHLASYDLKRVEDGWLGLLASAASIAGIEIATPAEPRVRSTYF